MSVEDWEAIPGYACPAYLHVRGARVPYCNNCKTFGSEDLSEFYVALNGAEGVSLICSRCVDESGNLPAYRITRTQPRNDSTPLVTAPVQEPVDSAQGAEDVSDVIDLANPVARVAARFVDSLLVMMAATVFAGIVLGVFEWTSNADSASNSSDIGDFLLVLLFAIVVGTVYEAVMTSCLGWTFGKKLLGLTAIDNDAQRPLGYKVGIRRSLRQCVNWILFPIGIVSTLRLLSDRQHQTWYNRPYNVGVVWSVSETTRRRRPWMWVEGHVAQNQVTYGVVFIFAVLILFFFGAVSPLQMEEQQATRAIQDLVQLNGLGLVAFVATSAWAKHSRQGRLRRETSDAAALIVVILGVLSLVGILSGIGYIATSPSGVQDVSPDRYISRILILASQVGSLLALVGTWVVGIEVETDLDNAAQSDPVAPTPDRSDA